MIKIDFCLAHIGIAVKDCEKSGLFYCQVLGCEIIKEYQDENMKFVYLKLADQVIELIQYLREGDKPRLPGVIDHIAVSVNDISKETARLKDLGVTLLFNSPREVSEGRKILFLLGPDGERIELIQEG